MADHLLGEHKGAKAMATLPVETILAQVKVRTARAARAAASPIAHPRVAPYAPQKQNGDLQKRHSAMALEHDDLARQKELLAAALTRYSQEKKEVLMEFMRQHGLEEQVKRRIDAACAAAAEMWREFERLQRECAEVEATDEQHGRNEAAHLELAEARAAQTRAVEARLAASEAAIGNDIDGALAIIRAADALKSSPARPSDAPATPSAATGAASNADASAEPGEPVDCVASLATPIEGPADVATHAGASTEAAGAATATRAPADAGNCAAASPRPAGERLTTTMTDASAPSSTTLRRSILTFLAQRARADIATIAAHCMRPATPEAHAAASSDARNPPPSPSTPTLAEVVSTLDELAAEMAIYQDLSNAFCLL